MRWNPFAKDEPPEQSGPASSPTAPPTPPSSPPRNDAVLAEIRAARAQDPLMDTRPLHRAILAGEFLLPVHAPAEARADGRTAMRPIEFYNDDVPSLVAFTDLETLRDVMAREKRPGCDWTPIYASPLTRMAVQGDFARLVLNMNAESSYVLRPLVFGALAEGFVPAAPASDAEHAAEPLRLLVTESGPSPARRPPLDLGDGLRRALDLPPDARIVWFESGWPPDELRFNVALDLDPAEAAALHSRAQVEWIRHWPLPTPLGVHGRAILTSEALAVYGVPL